MGKSSSQTIGYEYSLGMHVGFCHGPIDRITRIRFDKRTAWCGNNFGGRIDVSARDLFGGKKREGGVAGAIDFEPGDLTQTPNDYLTTQLTDGPLPAFRNIAALVFRKFYFGMSPYLKPLEVRASRIFTRTDGLDQWYEAKAQIGPCGSVRVATNEFEWTLSSSLQLEVFAGNAEGIWMGLAFSSSNFNIYRSLDDGVTWEDTGTDTASFASGRFVSYDTVLSEFVVGQQGSIKVTTNNGDSFTTAGIPTAPGGVAITGLAAHGGVWVVIAGLDVWVSTTKGASWTKVANPIGAGSSYTQVRVCNGDFYIISPTKMGRASSATPEIWTVLPVPATGGNNINIGSIGERIFIQKASGGNLYQSDDNGTTWQLASIATAGPYNGSIFSSGFSDFIGVLDMDVAGVGRTLIVTTDGGTTWERSIGRPPVWSQIAINETSIVVSSSSSSDPQAGIKRIFYRSAEECAVLPCDMNPAHIIREVLTDKAWGMGYPEADIDDSSFTAAADKLYSEEMGISILWDRQQSIQDFLDLIVQHIDATIYVSRATGKFVLKLIRNDYTVGSLLTLGTDEVQGVENFSAPAQGDLISSVSAIYWDSVTGEQASVTVHDQALAVQQGAVVGTTSQYPGFTNRRIAAQVAYRDLRALSVPLRSCTVYANRVASSLNPGDVFKLDWPDISADPIIMRVTGIALGDGRTNRVRITCVEDVFSLGEAPIAQDVPSKWQDPAGRPVAPDARLVFEAPYYAVARQEGETVANQFLDAQPTAGWLMTTAKRPGSAINMDVFVDPGTGYVEEYVSDFSPWAVLTAAAGPTDTVLAVGSVADLSDAVVGQLALLGSELVRIDVVTDTAITVGRGCLDTVPASHAIGVNLVLWQDFADIGPTVYDEGEAIDVKLLPNSGGAQVAIDLVTADTLTFDQRAFRPYPPGLFKINGEAYPTFLNIPNPDAANAISVSWAHRDRLQQTGGTVADTTAANIGPEAATTYTAQLISTLDDSVFASTTGITGTSADFALTGYTQETLRVKLLAVRSALNSYQTHDWTFLLDDAFTPSSLASPPKLWFNESSAITEPFTGFAASWGNIGTSSASIPTVARGTSGQQPAITASAINALRTLTFDGVNDSLSNGVSAALDLFRNVSSGWVLAVYRKTIDDSAAPAYRNVFSASAGSSSSTVRMHVIAGGGSPYTANSPILGVRRLDGDSTGVIDAAQDTYNQWVMVLHIMDWANGDGFMWVDGEIAVQNLALTSSGNTSNTASVNALYIGSNPVPGSYCDMELGEIAAHSGAIPSATEIDKLFGYAAHKWGLTANLPIGHPYKSVAPTV